MDCVCDFCGVIADKDSVLGLLLYELCWLGGCVTLLCFKLLCVVLEVVACGLGCWTLYDCGWV